MGLGWIEVDAKNIRGDTELETWLDSAMESNNAISGKDS